MQTSLLLHTSLSSPLFYCFIFGATIFQYNLPYVITVRRQQIQAKLLSFTHINFHHWLARLGLMCMMISLSSLTRWQLLLFSCIGILTLMYSFSLLPFIKGKRLKDFGFVKILSLTVLWVTVTVVVPVAGNNVSNSSLLFLCVLRLLYLWVLCLLFDIRDITIDNNAGIKTIPVLLGKGHTRLLCYLLTGVFLVLSVYFAFQTQNIFVLNAYIISATATFFVIWLSNTYTSALFHLTCVDGLMLLQALLIIIGSV